MTAQPSDFKRLFTVDEANATLPLVRAICTDLAKLSRDVVERRERLANLRQVREEQGRADKRHDLYAEEVAQIEDELENDSRRLHDYVSELQALGVEPKNGLDGLVDFPSLLDGRVVFLCWRLAEPEVLYWHEIEAGFAGRQPLTAESGVGPKYGADTLASE
jgi:hypothetical protein